MNAEVAMWILSAVAALAFFGSGWLGARLVLRRATQASEASLGSASIADEAPDQAPLPEPPPLDSAASVEEALSSVLGSLRRFVRDGRFVLADDSGLPLAAHGAEDLADEVAALSSQAAELGERSVQLADLGTAAAIEIHLDRGEVLQVRSFESDGHRYLVSSLGHTRLEDDAFADAAARLRAALAPDTY